MKCCYVLKYDGQREKMDDALIERVVNCSCLLSFPVIVGEAHKSSLILQFFTFQKDPCEII